MKAVTAKPIVMAGRSVSGKKASLILIWEGQLQAQASNEQEGGSWHLFVSKQNTQTETREIFFPGGEPNDKHQGL